MKEKSKEYNFIRNFRKISIDKILKEHKYSPGNFYTGRLSNEKEKIIKKEILKGIYSLLLEDIENV